MATLQTILRTNEIHLTYQFTRTAQYTSGLNSTLYLLNILQEFWHLYFWILSPFSFINIFYHRKTKTSAQKCAKSLQEMANMLQNLLTKFKILLCHRLLQQSKENDTTVSKFHTISRMPQDLLGYSLENAG